MHVQWLLIETEISRARRYGYTRSTGEKRIRKKLKKNKTQTFIDQTTVSNGIRSFPLCKIQLSAVSFFLYHFTPNPAKHKHKQWRIRISCAQNATHETLLACVEWVGWVGSFIVLLVKFLRLHVRAHSIIFRLVERIINVAKVWFLFSFLILRSPFATHSQVFIARLEYPNAHTLMAATSSDRDRKLRISRTTKLLNKPIWGQTKIAK